MLVSATASRSDSAISLSSASPAGEIAFKISRTQYGRKGWKVTPNFAEDAEEVDFKVLVAAGVLDRVLGNIKQLELAGHAVPERMTVKIR